MLGLLLNSKLTDKQRHKATLAQSSAQSLLALINDILDFSKVEAGKLELETMDFNLRSLLGEFAEAMALRAQEKGLEMILDVTLIEHSTVQGDPGRLRQILTNIVGNSIKFTETGEIVIKAGLKEITNNNIIFFCSIKDTGIGIPKEKQSKLFDAFTQVDASTTRKYGGTGLGLSIVKRLCELMGGSISVSSKPGNGTCFEFTILLQTSDHSIPVIPKINISKLNLLVVDDNKTNREVLIGQLEHWGAEVTEASDGPSALNCLYERAEQSTLPPFDVAFLDMQMPGMDGATLGKTIRSDIRFTNMKMVMMTSMSHRGEAKFFADHGFNAYFPKPATTSDLFDALAVVVDGGEALRQAGSIVTHDYLQTLDHRQPSQWPANTRLLLVEDNRINQEVALGVLDSIEIQADVAGDGLEALHALTEAPDENPYTLVLMDCQMPEMDGYEASRNIRAGNAGERNLSIPIIAMTANAMKGDKEKCLEAGMSDYLTKPIDPDELNGMMEKWLEKSTNSLMEQKMTNPNEEDAKVWDRAAVLKRLGGKEKFLNKLLILFASDASARMEELQTAVDEGNISEITNLAHTIKGSAANISGLQLQQCAADMELMEKEGKTPDIEALMKEINKAYQLLNNTLVQYQESVEALKE
jgi:two-component system, sensor histidine kinase and response regulator